MLYSFPYFLSLFSFVLVKLARKGNCKLRMRFLFLMSFSAGRVIARLKGWSVGIVHYARWV